VILIFDMVESKDESLKKSPKKFTRRKFLRGVGALAAGAVVAGCQEPDFGRKKQEGRREAMMAAKVGWEKEKGKERAIAEKTSEAMRQEIIKQYQNAQEISMTTDEVRNLEKVIRAVWQERFSSSPEIKITMGIMTPFRVTAKEGVPLRDLPTIQGKQIGDLYPGYKTPLVKYAISFGSGEEKQDWGIFSIGNLKQDRVVRPGEDGIVKIGDTKIGFACLEGMESYNH